MYVCSICGKTYEGTPMFCNNICSEKCYEKYFWDNVLDDKAIIINGECYHIGKENSVFKGHSGRKFKIEFNDGITLTTNNLWYNGKIPEEYKKEDNAKFIS